MASSLNGDKAIVFKQHLASYRQDFKEDLLSNLASNFLSKRRKPSVKEYAPYFKFLKYTIEGGAGSLDPSWGILRNAANAFLTAYASQGGTWDWDARILTDQFSAMYFHARRILRSPSDFFKVQQDLHLLGDGFSKERRLLQEVLQMFEDSTLPSKPSCDLSPGSHSEHLAIQDWEEDEALQKIEDAQEMAPEMKVRFHKRLKIEKESEAKLKEINKELMFLQSYVDLEEEAKLRACPLKERSLNLADAQLRGVKPSAKRTRRQGGGEGGLGRAGRTKGSRRYLPHALFGQVQLTLGKAKTYICLRSAQGPPAKDRKADRFTHMLTVYQNGPKGCEEHAKVAEEISQEVSKKSLNKNQAEALRTRMLAKC